MKKKTKRARRPASPDEKIDLLNINEGVGNTRMARWKYEIYRRAILKAVPRSADGIAFLDLSSVVEALLPEDRRPELGSVQWHVTSVKLDLEARGEIERIPSSKPQRLRRPRVR